MKTNMTFTMLLIFSILIIGCDKKDEVEPEAVEIDLITPEFLESQEEIKETFGAIAQALIDGDMDKLIAFHAYSPKFTEFKNGELRNGGAANESFERSVFGAVTEVVKFNADDLQIAVYGDVANVTFHSDFHLKFGEELAIIVEQTSLLFVRTKDGWKIVHEHHSPLNENNG
jgi:ketosteroid isomerase-like protein